MKDGLFSLLEKKLIFFLKFTLLSYQFQVISKLNILLKTLGFTYLNPHVYSDTVFFLGNFSKNFLINDKILFGVGASVASFLFFFLIGYLSKFLSKYAQRQKIWKTINLFIIVFMSALTVFIFLNLFQTLHVISCPQHKGDLILPWSVGHFDI